MKGYVEHANIGVVDPNKTVEFLTTALPGWRIRGEGEYINGQGERIQWCHVGDENSYIALSSTGKGEAPDWQTRYTGVKHVGIVVTDLEAMEARLAKQGYFVDHRGDEHPYRKNAYYIDDHNLQFEFIEYFSQQPEQKNDYSL
ncbi:VOC family protein [Vibrio sp. T11.5]|uniref:VOC family protein n=1 Tax=Vibrio sp. T11.5 TaxID=2998836 RepID=UPI0022CD9E50|nr:VOC family protein [Vibrio sp. T11.5]MDA0117052.1 VOC family protein [Vibrio sp. T11.5]